jgi:phospholipid N-methyltransferase
MSLLFFKRVLANPARIGYIVPSSPFLIRRTAGLMDFSQDLTVVELGPGEGCHTRRIARRMSAGSRLVLIELDPHLASHLGRQFSHDPRVRVVQADAMMLAETLAELGISAPDYIVSGIPFTIMERETRESMLANIARAMGEETRFILYQASTRISNHSLFDLVRREHCLLNVPPLHVMELRKSGACQPAGANCGGNHAAKAGYS